MTIESKILAKPLINHLGYFNYILSQRNGNTSKAFGKKIPIDERTPLELLYHGTNNLFRASEHILNTDSEFNAINQSRKEELDPVDEAKYLYSNAVLAFEEAVATLSEVELAKTIKSPISGNDTTLDSWIATNIMHTLGHVAQALKFQGLFCEDLELFD